MAPARRRCLAPGSAAAGADPQRARGGRAGVSRVPLGGGAGAQGGLVRDPRGDLPGARPAPGRPARRRHAGARAARAGGGALVARSAGPGLAARCSLSCALTARGSASTSDRPATDPGCRAPPRAVRPRGVTLQRVPTTTAPEGAAPRGTSGARTWTSRTSRPGPPGRTSTAPSDASTGARPRGVGDRRQCAGRPSRRAGGQGVSRSGPWHSGCRSRGVACVPRTTPRSRGSRLQPSYERAAAGRPEHDRHRVLDGRGPGQETGPADGTCAARDTTWSTNPYSRASSAVNQRSRSLSRSMVS